MSQLLQRGLRRQAAIQESRSFAWILLIVLLPVAFFALISLFVAMGSGAILSLRGIVSVVVATSALWVTGHLFREVRRLGRLLKDPELIMRSDQDPDLVGGMHWSVLNPFSGWRD